jgi:hypothetical protein
LLGKFLDPQDGGDIFLQCDNRLSTGYMALCPRRELIIITAVRTLNPTWRREFLNPKARKRTLLSAPLFSLYRDKIITRWQNELRSCDVRFMGF